MHAITTKKHKVDRQFKLHWLGPVLLRFAVTRKNIGTVLFKN